MVTPPQRAGFCTQTDFWHIKNAAKRAKIIIKKAGPCGAAFTDDSLEKTKERLHPVPGDLWDRR